MDGKKPDFFLALQIPGIKGNGMSTSQAADEIRIKHELREAEPAVSVLSRALINRDNEVVLDVSDIKTPQELAALFGSIGEAPNDGVGYVRKSAAWAAATVADLSDSSPWAKTLLKQTGRTTFSNADYTVLPTDRYVAQVGTMSTSRVVTLPSAASVPAGTTITIRDESGTVDRTKFITITRAGSDQISTLNFNGVDLENTYVYQNDSVPVRLYSDGVSKWFVDDSLSAAMIHIPFAPSGNPSTGIFWGTHGANALSSMAGSITMDGSVGGHNEIRYVAPRQAIVTSLFSSSDVGYLQIGNNGWDGMYMFLSSQGTANASRTTIPSLPLVFKTNYWAGSAASYRTPTIRGEMDASGNPRLSVYAAGFTSPGGDVSTTWDPNYGGSGIPGRVFNPGTETLRIVTGGLNMLGNTITNAGASSYTVPAFSGANANTGVTFPGADVGLARNGVAFLYTDASNGTIFAAPSGVSATFLGRVGLAAGIANFTAIHRDGDPGTGWWFPSANQIAFSTGGTERIRFANAGVIIPTQTPASSGATGTTGTITWDASFIYVCTATNTWKRAALATW